MAKYSKRQHPPEQGVTRNPKQHVDGIPPSTKFANLITADHKILKVRNESRCGQRNALIVQNEFTNWIQSDPMETKDTSESMSCLRRFLAPLRRPEHIYTDVKRNNISVTRCTVGSRHKYTSSLRNDWSVRKSRPQIKRRDDIP